MLFIQIFIDFTSNLLVNFRHVCSEVFLVLVYLVVQDVFQFAYILTALHVFDDLEENRFVGHITERSCLESITLTFRFPLIEVRMILDEIDQVFV